MSSTSGQVRKDEYYITPDWLIDEMLDFVQAKQCFTASVLDHHFTSPSCIYVDPCAGGERLYRPLPRLPPYPERLHARYGLGRDYSGEHLTRKGPRIITVDVREDSCAHLKGDFLNGDISRLLDAVPAHVCGGNPPFSLAVPFVERALEIVQGGGVVFMLQRLNFLGSKKREAFWQEHPPSAVLVHTRRPAFDPDKPKQTDSIEYAHFFWVKGVAPSTTELHLSPDYRRSP
jgi:hypothetical protein